MPSSACKKLADILQREITISTVKDASTMGAVAVAEKAVGIISKLEDFAFSTANKKTPDPGNMSLYEERFLKYLKWYNVNDIM